MPSLRSYGGRSRGGIRYDSYFDIYILASTTDINRAAQAPHVHRFLTIFRRTVPMAIPNLQDIAVNL